MVSDVISHTGGWPGYITQLTRYPAQDITIIVLSNNESNAPAVSQGLAGIINNFTVEAPYIHREAMIDTAVLNKYTGVYRNRTLSMEIVKKDGKLFRRKQSSSDVALIPESATKFFYGDKSDRQIEFETDKTGKSLKCWFINGGVKMELTRDLK